MTTQNYLLTKARSDPDRVWPRPSRGIMKVLFVVCYITLSVTGTAAVACVALAIANPQVAKLVFPPTRKRTPVPPRRDNTTTTDTPQSADPAPEAGAPEPPAATTSGEPTAGLQGLK
jgi:hypothetical protein